MATIPTLRTWTAGEIVTAAMLNSNVRDAISFVLAPPYASVYQTAAQSLTTAVWAAINMQTEETDNDGMHSTSVNISRLTAVTPGWYQVSGQVGFSNTSSTGSRNARFAVNGAAVNASGVTTTTGNAGVGVASLSTRAVFLNAGDYAEIQGMQTSGAGLNTNVSGEFVSALNATWRSS